MCAGAGLNEFFFFNMVWLAKAGERFKQDIKRESREHVGGGTGVSGVGEVFGGREREVVCGRGWVEVLCDEVWAGGGDTGGGLCGV